MLKKLFKPFLFISGFSLLLLVSLKVFAGTAVTWNGSSYTVPSVGEENWYGADKVDGLLIALATHGFQKTGGAFTLTSEADFGGTAGLVGLYFGTRSSNDSTAGVFRLSNNESIGWRNAANSGNLLLTVDGSNNLLFNGTTLISSSGVVPVTAGGTGLTTYAVGDLIYATPNSSTLSRLAVGTSSQLLISNGTVPTWGQVANSHVSASAAIDRSKIASGTADHVVINSGAGALSSEATLAVTRGGTNIGTYSVGDLLYATPNSSTLSKLPIGSTGQVLKVAGGVPSWGSAAITASVAAKTADYTLTTSDDVILVSPTTGTVILSLPTSASASGKVFYINRKAIGTQIAQISAATGNTINGRATLLMGSENDSIAIIADGGTEYRSISEHIAVAAFATSNTARTINNDTITAVVMEDEVFDTHNAYNASTGVFTCPVTGKYIVRTSNIFVASASWESSEYLAAYLYKNGAQVNTIAYVGAASVTGSPIHGFTGGGIVSCNANDTLEARVYQNSDASLDTDGATTNNWVSFERIN